MTIIRAIIPLLVVCLFCVHLIDGAGFSSAKKKTPIPSHWNWPTSFPSKEQCANMNLHSRFSSDNKLNVHIVPHTHDDVGWLKTVDQYYNGANNSIQHAAVKYILDTAVEELLKDPSRTFVYVEQQFFQIWWGYQTDATRSNVKKLVANGQLEFLNGGWCMHDEAAAHYLDMIDQTTLGHQFIKQTFGITPTIGWQIDPFGHSATQAALLSGVVGFEALFFGRIDHQDHDQRMQDKNMEFIWRPSPSLGSQGQVFTGAFQNGNYGPPTGFCFDWFCNDAPMIDDPNMIDFNIPQRVQEFLNQISYQAAFTLGNELMITMGSDFQYENAREWFENTDKLIRAVNADGRINIFYSTPSQYVKAKNGEGLTFSVKTDDFFPYSDDDHAYWTGYFTSRPALKRYVRTSSALLQAARHLEVFGLGDGSGTMQFSKALGVAQHHDAVSGTAKQHVTFDYAQRLHIAQTQSQQMMSQVLGRIVTNSTEDDALEVGAGGVDVPQFVFCELSNITVCDLTTQVSPTSFQVLLYNPLARARHEYVSIPVSTSKLLVVDSTGALVTSQITEVFNVSSHTPASAQSSLAFIADVPPLGYRSYFIVASSSIDNGADLVYAEHPTNHYATQSARRQHLKMEEARKSNAKTFVTQLTRVSSPSRSSKKTRRGGGGLRSIVNGGDVTIENEFVALNFDGAAGSVKSYVNKASGVVTPLNLNYAYYQSYINDGQKSGAYIFRPATQDLPTPITTSGTLYVQRGPIVQEVIQVVNEWINQTFRIIAGQQFVEIEFTVGEIPFNYYDGKEVVLQYVTPIQSNGTWYTDSNAREMIIRQRNYRSSYNLTITEPIAGNFMPVNAIAYLNDGASQLTVLNDRSQGVTSMQDGTLEFMVHRRTLCDDGRGVGEPLNETDYISPYPQAIRQGRGLVITGKHYLMIGDANTAASQWRPQLQRIYQPLVEAYSAMAPGSVETYISQHRVEQSWIGSELPVNVDLITLQSWQPWTGKKGSVLVRLSHQFGVNEDSKLSQPVQVDLAKLLNMPPTEIEEVSLTAVRDASEAGQKLKWNTKEPEINYLDAPAPVPLEGSIVTLNPMEIKTFIFYY